MLLTVTRHGLSPSRVIVGRNALQCRRRKFEAGCLDRERILQQRCGRTQVGKVNVSQEVLAGEEAFEEGCGDVALLEVWVVKDASMERDGRLDAFDDEFVEGAAHAGDTFLPVSAVGNDLGDHGIVERDDHHIRLHGRIDTNAESAWCTIFRDHPGAGRKLFRVFRVDATFEAMSVELDVLLLE